MDAIGSSDCKGFRRSMAIRKTESTEELAGYHGFLPLQRTKWLRGRPQNRLATLETMHDTKDEPVLDHDQYIHQVVLSSPGLKSAPL